MLLPSGSRVWPCIALADRLPHNPIAAWLPALAWASVARSDGFETDKARRRSALCDAGADGEWAARQLADRDLLAPELVMFEAANVLRRLELTGDLSSSEAGPLPTATYLHSD